MNIYIPYITGLYFSSSKRIEMDCETSYSCGQDGFTLLPHVFQV